MNPPKPPDPPDVPPVPTAEGDVHVSTFKTIQRFSTSASAAPAAVGAASAPAESPVFQPQTTFEVAMGVSSLEMDGESVVTDLLSNKHFRLNGTASLIWRHVLQRDSFEQIAKDLAERFQLTTERSRDVTTAFLSDLVKNGLVMHSSN